MISADLVHTQSVTWTGLVEWTSGLDYWTHRFSLEHAGMGCIQLVNWTRLAQD